METAKNGTICLLLLLLAMFAMLDESGSPQRQDQILMTTTSDIA